MNANSNKQTANAKASKISPVKSLWVGVKPVRGAGPVAKKLLKRGFFKGGEALGFKFIRPCGTDACSILGKMRNAGIYGHVANVFTDLNWKHQKLTTKQRSVNYADGGAQ